MKKRTIFTALILVIAIVLSSCSLLPFGKENIPEGENLGYDYYAIDMIENYHTTDSLPSSDGEPLRVIILIGQSNCTGCSLTSYLKDGVGEEKYSEFERGYDSVLINYCLDNGKYSSGGDFVPVDLSCAAGEGYFGPEVGMAERLSEELPDEKFVILKFTMSGYSLNYHWLYDGERASIYNSFLIFATTYIDQLLDLGYGAELEAICWMQGESDTTEFKSERYLYNTERLVSFLREDLGSYSTDGEIYFIDAGISDSPYCLPSYREINQAKESFSHESELNVYFPTIEAGLTTMNEPYGNPDLGHYDAMSELTLGRMFGDEIIKILE